MKSSWYSYTHYTEDPQRPGYCECGEGLHDDLTCFSCSGQRRGRHVSGLRPSLQDSRSFVFGSIFKIEARATGARRSPARVISGWLIWPTKASA